MAKEKKTGSGKVWTVIGAVICLLLIPMLVINVTLIIKSMINETEVPTFGGYLPMIVLTDSMYPGIKSGDLIICVQEDAGNIKKGDIICFFDPASKNSSVVTHRVVSVNTEGGELTFTTKGDNNNVEDQKPVPAENLIGVYRMRIPKMGNVAVFMQSTAGLVCCVGVPVVLLVGYDMLTRKKADKANDQEKEELLRQLEELKAKQNSSGDES